MTDVAGRAWFRNLILSIALIAVCLPRFNRQDMGLSLTGGGLPATVDLSDAANYMAQVDYYRGLPPTDLLASPFTERLLAPWLAARLPFWSMTALNIVNVLALVMALILIDATLGLLGAGNRGRWLGGALFVFSFPTFYYGAIGIVDPVLIGFLAAALYFLLAGRVWLFVALALGGLTRETIILFLPVLAVHYLFVTRRTRRDLAWALAGAAAAVGGVLLARWLSPVVEGGGGWAWLPSWELFIKNATRPRAWVGAALTLGVPGALAFWVILARRPLDRRLWPLVAGLVTCLALFAFAMLTAYADGRFVWPAVVFTIPIAVHGLFRAS